MTETIKSKLNGFLLTLIITLLGFIASGMVYLIRTNDSRYFDIDAEQKILKSRQDQADKKLQNVIWAQINDPDTSPDVKQMLLSEYVDLVRSIQQ